MSSPRNDGTTTVGGGVSGTGIAIGAGAQARVTSRSDSSAPDLAAAVETLRAQLVALDLSDDDTAERVALAESRLQRLEAAAATTGDGRDPGRVRRLFDGVVAAVGGVATLAGSIAALESAVETVLR